LSINIFHVIKRLIGQFKTILTAICRSERFAMGGEPWGRYVDAGCFPAILRRLGELTYNV
jgi:hypothetical protein